MESQSLFREMCMKSQKVSSGRMAIYPAMIAIMFYTLRHLGLKFHLIYGIS